MGPSCPMNGFNHQRARRTSDTKLVFAKTFYSLFDMIVPSYWLTAYPQTVYNSAPTTPIPPRLPVNNKNTSWQTPSLRRCQSIAPIFRIICLTGYHLTDASLYNSGPQFLGSHTHLFLVTSSARILRLKCPLLPYQMSLSSK